MNIDNWTFSSLKEAVAEFQSQQYVVTQEDDDAMTNHQTAEDYARNNEYEDIQKTEVFEDAPKVQIRKYAPTKGIEATPINFTKTVIKVTDSVVKKGGFFSSDYVLYVIQTSPTKWKVDRKDADFYTLRRLLKREFPHVLMPPLPTKTSKMT